MLFNSNLFDNKNKNIKTDNLTDEALTKSKISRLKLDQINILKRPKDNIIRLRQSIPIFISQRYKLIRKLTSQSA